MLNFGASKPRVGGPPPDPHLYRVFEIPQVSFAFEFESERPNGNSVTKQSLNHHSSDLDKVSQFD